MIINKESIEFAIDAIELARESIVLSSNSISEKETQVNRLNKALKLITPCWCCLEVEEDTDDTGYCKYCRENGNYCKDCEELFVDDCINDYCFDCRLDYMEDDSEETYNRGGYNR